MTWALCLNCGETKFGAICPCPSCQTASTGDMALDIAFSDHRMTVETIKELGEVVRAIQRVCDDDELRFWAFIAFVSTNFPEILHVDLKPEAAERCGDVLALAEPPRVVFRESDEARITRQFKAGDDADGGS